LDAEHAVFKCLVEHAIVGDGVIDKRGFVVDFDGSSPDEFAANNVFIVLFFVFKFGETPFAIEKTHGFLL
jgi:hypothetical protein